VRHFFAVPPALLTALALMGVGCSSSSSSASPTSPAADASTIVDASPKTDASDAASPHDAGAAEEAGLDAAGIVAARPYELHVPASYDPSKPAPLVVMFHGYGASGGLEEYLFDMTAASDANGFLYAYGNGTLDPTGSRFWNATNACCDFYDAAVDDVTYFDAIVADVSSKHMVDPKRVYVIGHSNGAFMSHRLACDRASKVAAIVSLAGAQWYDTSHCNPSEAVPVAEVHGTADMTIDYDGGYTMETLLDAGPEAGTVPFAQYPSAPTTVADWAAFDHCTAGSLAPNGTTYDLDSQLPGNETQVQAYAGCPSGIDVQLWVIQGGVHIPTLTKPGWADAVWGFLSAHAKP
jgi:polyhydroxybutyrate depolymerase